MMRSLSVIVRGSNIIGSAIIASVSSRCRVGALGRALPAWRIFGIGAANFLLASSSRGNGQRRRWRSIAVIAAGERGVGGLRRAFFSGVVIYVARSTTQTPP